ncbi:MAG TPA: TonB-dependent receptor [Opitutaceae bacterium]
MNFLSSASRTLAGCLIGVSSAAFSIAIELPVALDRFDVTTSRFASLTSPVLDAARADLASTPGGVDVVDAEQFLRGRASTVADTFAFSAGVFAQPRFGSDEARLSIRGSGLQRTFHGRGLRVLQDGVPVNLADGSFDFQALEPASAAYINVWRGANALAFGASTMGGAIDYVSRTGRDAPPLLARVEAGSFDYLRTSLAGGGARGRGDAYAAFTHQSQAGFRAHAAQRNDRLFANAGARLSEAVETRFFLTGVATDSELPGSLTKAQLGADPSQAAAVNLTLNQKRDFELLRIANKTTLRAGRTMWDLSAAWSYKDLDHPIHQVVDQLSNDLMVGLAATRSGELLGRTSRLRAGVLFQRGTTRAANFANVGGRRGALISSADQRATNGEGFAELQTELGRGFTLATGATVAANRRRNERVVGGAPSYTLAYDEVSPKLGLRWDGADVQVYANVSGSYEPPSFSETLINLAPRAAQTATTLEVGTRGERGAVRWDLSLYAARVRHELLSLVDPVTLLAATINADRTTHAGVELSGELDLLGSRWNEAPARRLVLRGAWTYGRFKFDDDPIYGDRTLAGLPPHLIRVELAWETASGWYVGPNVEWVPQKAWIDHRNTLAADPYAIGGFRFGRRNVKGFSWFAEARNVFDKHYAATTGVIEYAGGADQPQFLPGDGRAAYAGVEWRW